MITSLAVSGASNVYADDPANSTAVSPAAMEAGAQLTLELRDGSRIVCKGLDDPLHFHSVSLGEVKLPISDILSIEFAAKGDDGGSAARLTATNGDVLDVQFIAPTLHVETGFGKSELPVKMIKSIKVSSVGQGMEAQMSGASGGMIQNPSFETPCVKTNSTYFSFINDPKNAGWIFTGMSGIAENDSAYTYPAYRQGTPYGNQYAYLQSVHGVNGAISQIISNFQTGNYIFSFAASQRDHVGRDNTENQTVTVMVDGTSVGSFTPADTNWYCYQTTPILLNADNHTLVFTNCLITGDATILIDNIGVQNVAPTTKVPSVNEKCPQLTIELRDGSRLLGKSLDDPLKFHSPSLGDLKLPVAGIGSLKLTDNGDNSSAARLTATNGDVLDVQFIAPTLHVETGFGKSELPVKMIRSIKVSSLGISAQNEPLSSSPMALWEGNGNGEESVGTNSGSVHQEMNYGNPNSVRVHLRDIGQALYKSFHELHIN